MALIKADRVRETTTTTGTGAISLAGAATGYRAFSAVCAGGDTCYYAIVSQTGTEWETGLGTFSTPATLTRTTVHSSSNSGSAVNFTAGTKDVFIALTAMQFSSLTNIDLTSQVTGVLPLANGGTGQATASAALNALLPSQSGNNGKYLTTNGTTPSWADNPLGTVTSVGGIGTVNGLTLTGTVTTSGNLTLGGTLSGVSLTSQVTGTLPVANGGTGTTTGSITGTGALTFAAGGSNQNVTINPSGTGYANVAGVQIKNKGSQNVGIVYALTNVSTGVYNLGIIGLTSVTTGSYSVGIGTSSIGGVYTSNYSTAVGHEAGYKNSLGNLLNDPEGCTYIGALSRGQDNYESNAIVIGYDARGKGANTTVIGNSSTTQTWLGGGELRLPGSTSGYVGLKGAAVAGSVTYTLPSADGTSGQILSTNGSGVLSWSTVASSGGTVTSVGGTGTVNGITLTGTVTSSGNLTLGGTLSGVSLTSQVTGTLPVVNGGTGQTTASAAFNALSPLTTLGDVLYASGANTSTRLAGNTTTTKNFLSQTGTGSASAAPAWSTVSKSDVGLSNVENTALSTWAGSSNITTLGTVATGTWNATTIGISKGGTGATTAQDGINALAGATTSGQYLRGNGTNVVMSAIQAGDVPTLNQNTTGTASNVTGTVAIANGGTGQTTAANAINALLPTQTSNSGKYLTTNGTAASWATVSASPAGSSGQIQYNSSGSFAGASKFTVQSSGWPDVVDQYNNSGIGSSALNNVTSGSGNNAAFGWGVLRYITTGVENSGFGTSCCSSFTTSSSRNAAFGYASLMRSTSANDNTATGNLSGYSNLTGNQNTFIGSLSGTDTTSYTYTGTNSNCSVIGYSAKQSSWTVNNEITLGNSSISTLRCQVTSITSLSDQRDKTNIQPMPSVLSFIASLNPVRFDWWTRDGAKIGVPDYGFIAQELQQAQTSNGFDWAQLVYESNPEKLEASPGKLIPILVKAIQELSAKVAALEAAN